MGIILEKIIIKITSSEIEKIEAIMHKMSLIPSVELSKLSYGQLGDDVIASFDVDDSHYALMMEKLYTSGFNILPTNDKATQVLEFLYGKYGKRTSSKTSNQQPKGPVAISSETINEHKSQGKYDELIKIMKTVNIDPNLKNDAKNSLIDAVKKNIDHNYNYAFINKHAVPTSISNLLRICSDVNLKTFNMQPLQKQAGLAAIAICENYSDYIDELIKVSNNNQIPSGVNLKAAVKFWEIVKKDTEKFSGDIAIAFKSLNIRFLENSFDVAQGELEASEIELFNEFRDFIKSKKLM